MSMLDDFKLLQKRGFSLIPYAVAKDENQAVVAAKKIGYPVALKIISEEVSHKTDIGGVKIRLKNEQAVRIAYNDIVQVSKKYKIIGVLVQKMARKGVELIIGGRYDSQFGNMVVLGLGGVYVEVFRDITARICPITKNDVDKMVYELKSHPILTGIRGQKSINMHTLENILIRVCKFMKKERVKEIDLNPVVFDQKGCDIVDVRFQK